MELRDFAWTVLTTGDLFVKLAPPREELTDEQPGPAFRAEGPGRPPDLRFAKVEVPSIEGMPDPAQRPRILHALANHELQAAELFAWALLAFPDAPPEFRQGLAHILQDEQRHTRMYIARLEDIPNVGPAVAADLRQLGITSPGELAGRGPYVMHDDLCRITGQRHDSCLLDTFIAAGRYMEGGPKKPWWAYTAERKREMAVRKSARSR